MLAVFGFVFVAGCYESYQNYGEDTSPLVNCEVTVMTNAPNSTIAVDGTVVTVPVTVAVGSRVFAATAPGYFPTSQTVEVIEDVCAPVELTLLPDIRGDWDITFVHTIEDRLILHLEQDGTSIWGFDRYEESDEIWQEFEDGSVGYDGDVHLLSNDSVRLDIIGIYLAPNRMEGTWTTVPGGGGTWWATRR